MKAMKLTYNLLRKSLSQTQSVRRFSTNPFRNVAAKEMGQDIGDDFLPDREQLEIDTRAQEEAKIALKGGKGPDTLRH